MLIICHQVGELSGRYIGKEFIQFVKLVEGELALLP